jgi:hypothetical protein
MSEAPIPAIALRREKAAAALDVSEDFFDQHVRPELRAVRRGRLTLYLATELQRWAERNAALVLEEAA